MDIILDEGVIQISEYENERVIPKIVNNSTRIGTVIKGNDKYKQGDVVFYDEYASRSFDFKDKTYLLLDTRHEGVWATIKT